MFNLCLDSGRWKKWFPSDFDPHQNKKAVVETAGHYVFSTPEFQRLKGELSEADSIIRERLVKRLRELHKCLNVR
jgi:hypothetical protein